MASNIKNTPKLLDNEKVNIQRGAIAHRSTWMGLTYLEAQKAGKAEDGEKFARAAISKTGFGHGEGYKAKCTKTPTDCVEFAEIFLGDVTKNSFEIELKTATPERIDLEFGFCPLLKGWQDQGLDDDTCAKLCDIAMDGDRNIAAGMGLDFHLGKTLAQGHHCCEVSFFRKK